MLKKKCNIIVFILVILVVGMISYFFGSKISCNKQKYKFINQDLICDDKIVVSKKGYETLKSLLENIINQNISKKEITSASIYFRDLQNGPTLGINEYVKFSPASLLKLPLLITYIDLGSDHPDLLDTKIGFDNLDEDLEQYYPSKVVALANTPYKIDDLLSYMIKYSDNNSYYALREYLKQIDSSKDLLQQTFFDLGIIDPINNNDQTISVKSYSSIFIQMYHNSYFSNKDHSEKVLELLAESDFNDGLAKGLPKNIKLAHKFGERSSLPNSEKQLHDCGIIYYPKNPYLLCVMTRGKDFSKLSNFIGEVSSMVYREFDSRKF